MAEIPFTVIIPTHNHAELIKYPIECVLSQTFENFELFIIGDGISEEGRQCVQAYTKKDSRIRFFDFPKGPRHGEEYRHQVLQSVANGKYICYVADDDLVAKYHLEGISQSIGDFNFIHPLGIYVTGSGKIGVYQGDLKFDSIRDRLQTGLNFMPLTGTCHSMELYRKLPFGWRTTPPGIATDLYMWQQILSHPECRPLSTFRPSLLHFISPERTSWSLQQRAEELASWSEKILSPDFESWISPQLIEHLASMYTYYTEILRQTEESLQNEIALRIASEKQLNAPSTDPLRANE